MKIFSNFNLNLRYKILLCFLYFFFLFFHLLNLVRIIFLLRIEIGEKFYLLLT